MIKIAGKIPKQTLKTLLRNFDNFEKRTDETNNLEILVCKLIDKIQGHHFSVVFGNDFEANSDLINKILNRSFVREASKLLEVLNKEGHTKAYKEVESVVEYLISLFKKAGVKLNLDKIKI